MKQVAWFSVIPQLCVMGVIIALMFAVEAPAPVITGALVYLALSIFLRRLIPRAHRRGVALIRRKQFSAAIPHFERSYAFFTRHAWIDELRHLVLLSSSRVSYREMALLNVAYCHGQNGDGGKSKEYYQRTLDEFPESEIAKASLNMFEAAEGATQQPPAGDSETFADGPFGTPQA